MKLIKYTLFSLSLCICLNAYAENATQQLQQILTSIKTMQANFSQTVHSGRKIIQRSNGSMALQRPGRFRWNSMQPTQQLIIADGKKLWIYDKDLQQVTVKKLTSGLDNTPAAFLSGSNQLLARDYQVKLLSNNKSEQRYQLIPKSNHASFRYIDLNLRGNQILGMRLVDKLGQSSDLQFSSVRVNQAISAGLFHFQAPRGVDVVGS